MIGAGTMGEGIAQHFAQAGLWVRLVDVKAGYGFRLSCLGPLETHDLNGLDIVLKAGGKTRKTLFNGSEPSPALVEKAASGELGVKTGKGWYDYQGRSREEILAQSHRKLLQQLIVFETLEKSDP